MQSRGVATEHRLERVWLQGVEDVANGGMAWCALPVQAKRGIQSMQMHSDEGLDRPKGIAAGDHGKDREQQHIGQPVAFAFGPAWVGNIVEHGKKRIERAHDNLLVIGLPGIGSEISPRWNPPLAAGLCPIVAFKTA